MTRQTNIGRGLLELREVYTKVELVALLKDMIVLETIARDNYMSDVRTFKDEAITTTIECIKEDEDRHIELLEGLIKMLKDGS
jgi:predicted RecB family endonuclease